MKMLEKIYTFSYSRASDPGRPSKGGFPMRRAAILLFACCLAVLCAATSAQARQSILVVGDSLSIPLGERLETYFDLRSGVEFHRQGKVSSGLARPDFYDWEAVLQRLARAYQPDLLVVMLGTNDFKPLKVNAGSLRFGSNAWNREYGRRVQRLIDIARAHNPRVAVYWVGAPVMGKKDLDQAVRHVNKVIQVQVERNRNSQFIDTRETLADASGRFALFANTDQGRVKLRADDGVHLTNVGATLLADRCLQFLDTVDTQPELVVLASTQRTPAKTVHTSANVAPERLPAQVVQIVAATHQESATPPPYAIQESSWNEVAQAKRRAGQLAAKGLSAWVKSVNLGAKGVWHRVMIGSFETLATAKRHKLDLSKRFALSHTLIIKLG